MLTNEPGTLPGSFFCAPTKHLTASTNDVADQGTA